MTEWIERQVRSAIVHKGHVISVRHDEIELPDGRRSTRDVVDSPGAVGIVALDAAGNVLLVRQYRYACGKHLIELPAGTLSPGEEPLRTAQRELQEETGYTAGRWTHLGTWFTSPGYASSRMHVFLAEELREGVASPDDEEYLELLRLPWAEAVGNLNRFEDAKTIAGLALAAAHLTRRGGRGDRAAGGRVQGQLTALPQRTQGDDSDRGGGQPHTGGRRRRQEGRDDADQGVRDGD